MTLDMLVQRAMNVLKTTMVLRVFVCTPPLFHSTLRYICPSSFRIRLKSSKTFLVFNLVPFTSFLSVSHKNIAIFVRRTMNVLKTTMVLCVFVCTLSVIFPLPLELG